MAIYTCILLHWTLNSCDDTLYDLGPRSMYNYCKVCFDSVLLYPRADTASVSGYG